MSHDRFRSWEGRCWVDSSPVHIVSEGLPKVRFITYRLLAHYKTSYLNYSSHKTWDYRSKIVLKELACYNADIICLQDVDLFQEFWYPRLMSMGYDMVFKQRTQEKEYRNEGVLTAFRRDRFQLCRTVAYEFNNAVQDDSKGSTFRERCRTDDVGLITFIQPNNRKDIPCMLGVANAMLSELAVNSDVRAMHMEYFTQQIELANREFQAPILMGVNLNDIPASPVYTLLRTGRVALSAQVPLACTDVRATPTCRGSALVQWLPPKMSIADSPISTYEIAWRPGGSSTLGFTLFRSVVAGDCIHYSEQTDERGKKKIVADAVLQFTIPGLCSDIVYEFIVRGINSEGPGLWSAPSEPVILPNPEKAPRLPDLDQHFFTGLDGVYEIRERVAMSESDWNISLAMKADPLNAPTQLTPRIAGEGRINYPIARSRLLPALDNPRLGWKGSLGGIQDPSMTAEISRDYVLSKSILRDKHGYRERNLNDLQYELSSANEGRYAGSVSSTISILQLSDPAGSFAGDDGPEGTLSTTIDENNTFSHSVITDDASSVRYPENHLLQQLEEVSIRMVTDDDAQHIPLSTSYMFSSARENLSAVPSLFKKQRDQGEEEERAEQEKVASTVDTASTADDVFVIPFSGASRPVYRTSKENNARLLYQYPTPLLLPTGDKSVDEHELVEENSVMSGAQAKEHLQLLKVPGLCTFAQLNPVVNPLTHLGPANAIAKTLDGTSLLLDGREVLHHIGASHPRHRHGLGLRSAYEVGGSTSGEPIFTAVIPKERNSFGTETFDYIFYSQSHGLVPCSHLALPSIASVMQSYSMMTGRGETPEAPIIVIDQQTSRPPIAFEDGFDQKVLALYAKTYDLTHDGQDGDEVADGVADSNAGDEDDDPDDIDYGYGYSEERKKSNKKKKELTAEMKRKKLDDRYTPADVQIMKRMLKESLRKSHALDDQTTQHRPGSTNQNFSAQQNRASSATNSNKMSKKAKALANNVQYYASQYKGNNFWGGQWQSLPMRNPSRNNFFLPNARFPSSHFALGADFVINEDLLPALWK